MSVFQVKAGKVSTVWRDVATVDEWCAKYLAPVEIEPAKGEEGAEDYVPAVMGSAKAPEGVYQGEAVAGLLAGDPDPETGVPVLTGPVVTLSSAQARLERNTRISATDWTQLPDAPLTDAERAAWAAYRQALRDVPDQDGFPGAIAWPVEP